MKIGIVVITFNLDSRIFLLQMECIKRFCKDRDYTIEIVDNSDGEEFAEGIKHHAGEQSVNYRKVHSGNKDFSKSHSFAANFAYRMLKDSYDMFFYLDHDCIPVKEFSVERILEGGIMAGVRSGLKIDYFWPGCLMWNNLQIEQELINFNPINELRADTGGELYRVIDMYGKEMCIFFDEIGCENPDFNATPLYYFYMMIYKETFMHFLNASNWNPTEENEKRLSSLINIANNKINGE